MPWAREDADELDVHEKLLSGFEYDEDDRMWMSVFPTDEGSRGPNTLFVSLDGAALLAANLLSNVVQIQLQTGEPILEDFQVEVIQQVLKRLEVDEDEFDGTWPWLKYDRFCMSVAVGAVPGKVVRYW